MNVGDRVFFVKRADADNLYSIYDGIIISTYQTHEHSHKMFKITSNRQDYTIMRENLFNDKEHANMVCKKLNKKIIN